MIVTIPSRTQHEGLYLGTYEISNFCPKCGMSRGKILGTHSFDGSRRMNVDGWHNKCGHLDKYCDVRKEGKRVEFKKPKTFNLEK